MKHWLIFGVIFMVGVVALVFAELRKADAPVSPRAILNFIADTQREMARLPARVTRLSDAEEMRAGETLSAYARIPTEAMTEEDRQIAEYVDRVGQRIAVRARRKIPYRFNYLPDPNMINAFALPGGHVFIGGGLLHLMKTEDELAAVLGHEIEHVDLFHCAERLQVEARLRKIPLGGLIGLPVVMFQAGYSKAQELEADREGTRLAVRAGYSPYGAVNMFKAMEEMRERYMTGAGRPQGRARTPQGEISQVALETLKGYFRSHPLPEERIRQTEAMIARLGWEKMTEQKPLAFGPPADATTQQRGEMVRSR